MIKHVVFFKFKPDVTPAERRSVLDQLRELPAKIDVIRSFEIGEDIMHSARAWDAVEIATYDDLGALETYTRHDDHVELVLKLREICDDIGSVDYEFLRRGRMIVDDFPSVGEFSKRESEEPSG